MSATIYHNPRCSKSREALQLLEEAGADVRVVEYLKVPPTPAELRDFYTRAEMTARDGLRMAEPDAKALAGADEATILAAMAANPALIERPLVATDKGAVLARPPERVRDVL